MPKLEPIKAVPKVREPKVLEATRLDPVRTEGPRARIGAMLNGPIFTRARDIIAANVTELLDKAEDPARMIRMIIAEMEEVLVEVRATAARSIADLKEMRRKHAQLETLVEQWTERAQLALSKDREDLAKQALIERSKVSDVIDNLHDEMRQIEETLRGYEAEIAKLQKKLSEARARQASISSRIESAMTRARAREMVYGSRTQDAFSRFEMLERRADLAEGHAEAMGLAGPRDLEEEIADLKAEEKAEEDLQAMKAARAASKDPANEDKKEGE